MSWPDVAYTAVTFLFVGFCIWVGTRGGRK